MGLLRDKKPANGCGCKVRVEFQKKENRGCAQVRLLIKEQFEPCKGSCKVEHKALRVKE